MRSHRHGAPVGRRQLRVLLRRPPASRGRTRARPHDVDRRRSSALAAAAAPICDRVRRAALHQHLAVSGARWFKKKGMGGLTEAIEIVEACRRICEWSVAPCAGVSGAPSPSCSRAWLSPRRSSRAALSRRRRAIAGALPNRRENGGPSHNHNRFIRQRRRSSTPRALAPSSERKNHHGRSYSASTEKARRFILYERRRIEPNMFRLQPGELLFRGFCRRRA